MTDEKGDSKADEEDDMDSWDKRNEQPDMPATPAAPAVAQSPLANTSSTLTSALQKAPAKTPGKSKWAGLAQAFSGQPVEEEHMKALMALPPPPRALVRSQLSVPTQTEMAEYLNVLSWSESSALTFPFMLLLWVIFVYIVWARSLVEMSYEIKQALTLDVESVVVPHHVLLHLAHHEMDQSHTSALSQCRCMCVAHQDQDPPKGACTSTMGAQELNFVSWVPRSIVKDPAAKVAADANMGFDSSGTDAAGLLVTTLGWGNITNARELKTWVHHGYIPKVWQGRRNAQEMRLSDWNRVIGGVRARQRRLKRGDCTFSEDLQKWHRGACYANPDSELADEKFGNPSRMTAETVSGFVPNENDTTAFDCLFDAGETLQKTMFKVEALWNAAWIDEDTYSLELETGILNLEVGVFGKLTVGITFKTGGRIERKIDVKLKSCISFEIVELIPEMIWCVLIFSLFIQELVQIVRAILEGRRDGSYDFLKDYATDFWNLLDWFSIFLGIAIGVFWFVIGLETNKLAAQIGALPAYTATSVEETVEYQKQWGAILDSMGDTFLIQMFQRLSLFWYTMVLMMRFFKTFLGQPRLALMTNTLIDSLRDVVHMLVIFAVLFFNFTLGGYVLFGTRMEKWCSMSKAIHTSFLALFGRLDLAEMFNDSPVSATIWFWLFMLSMIFVMSNLFFSVIYDHYNTMKIKVGSTPSIFWQMEDSFHETIYNLRWRKDAFRNDGCKVALIGPPSKKALLEGFLDQTKASDDARLSCERGSIGYRLYQKRQNDERAAHEKANHTEVDAKQLQKLELDKEGALRLMHKCMQYTKMVSDAHDNRLTQIQDFVETLYMHIAHFNLRCGAIEEDVTEMVQPIMERAAGLEYELREGRDELNQIATTKGIRVAAAPPPRAVNAEASYNFSNWQKLKEGISSMLLDGTL